MFIVLLKFSKNKSAASRFMDGHNAWLTKGFDDGVFVLAGSLQAGSGGGILAHNMSRAELERRVAKDPFVDADVVVPEIIEVTAHKTEERLAFLRA